FQLGGAAHMVKVAVGAQDVGEGGALLFQQGVVVLRGGGRVDDRGVAPLRDQQEGIGVHGGFAHHMICLHLILPSSIRRYPSRWCRGPRSPKTPASRPRTPRAGPLSGPGGPSRPGTVRRLPPRGEVWPPG